jgi:hypothetical protein
LYAFSFEDPGELQFAKWDLMEIVDDTRVGGWWVARLDGKTGLIPYSFVEDL